MKKRIATRTERKQVALRAGIINAPSAKQLRPTEDDRRVLKELSEWEDRSRKSHWIL
jgi:hypothetical protein